jgi:hypothetical protein
MNCQHLRRTPIKRNDLYNEMGGINVKKFLSLFGWQSNIVLTSFRNLEYQVKR